jgi:hypothetical protein
MQRSIRHFTSLPIESVGRSSSACAALTARKRFVMLVDCASELDGEGLSVQGFKDERREMANWMIFKALGGACLVLGCLAGSPRSAIAQEEASNGFFPPTWGPADKIHMLGQAADLVYRANEQPWLLTALELYNRAQDGLVQTALWSPTVPITGKWPDDKFPWSELICRTIASEHRWYTSVPFGPHDIFFLR